MKSGTALKTDSFKNQKENSWDNRRKDSLNSLYGEEEKRIDHGLVLSLGDCGVAGLGVQCQQLNLKHVNMDQLIIRPKAAAHKWRWEPNAWVSTLFL